MWDLCYTLLFAKHGKINQIKSVCLLISESNHRSEPGSGYWQLQLDRDLVDTISAIYPEWFKDNMSDGGASGGGAAGGRPPSPLRESPPKAVIDTSPIHMDQNKECK